MKRTLVIYQYPNAKGDVLRWAIDHAAHEVIDFVKSDHWVVSLVSDESIPIEQINIIPHFMVYTLRDKGFDKVVLYGAFEASFLTTVLTEVKGSWLKRSQTKKGEGE